MPKRKHHHEEHEEHVNHEAWVIPYADMLTLLMAMFLVLWAIGQVDVSKAKAVSTGFADEFGLARSAGKGAGGNGVLDGAARPDTPQKVDSKQKVDKTMAIAAENGGGDGVNPSGQAQLEQIQQEITQAADKQGLGQSLKFRMEARGLVVSIVAEGVLFDAGSATLRPAGTMLLDEVAGSLINIPNNLVIEGHTDDRPISTAQFPSNWELSTARAASVLRYLTDRHHITPVRLSAAGYGEQRPVAGNDTDGGRARNRRVDVAILGMAATTPAPAEDAAAKDVGSKDASPEEASPESTGSSHDTEADHG